MLQKHPKELSGKRKTTEMMKMRPIFDPSTSAETLDTFFTSAF